MVPASPVSTAGPTAPDRFTILIAPLPLAFFFGHVERATFLRLFIRDPGHQTEPTEHGGNRSEGELNFCRTELLRLLRNDGRSSGPLTGQVGHPPEG